jgi:hypothetical protein
MPHPSVCSPVRPPRDEKPVKEKVTADGALQFNANNWHIVKQDSSEGAQLRKKSASAPGWRGPMVREPGYWTVVTLRLLGVLLEWN